MNIGNFFYGDEIEILEVFIDSNNVQDFKSRQKSFLLVWRCSPAPVFRFFTIL